MIELNLTNLEDLARGTAFLATGGGGDPYIGKLMLKHQLEQGKKVKIISPDEIDDDTFACNVLTMGAPTVFGEKAPNGLTSYEAMKKVEEIIGKKFNAIMPIEAGGVNATLPLVVGALSGLPVIDADGMGRAFPELQMVTYNVGDVSINPLVVINDFYDCKYLEDLLQSEELEMSFLIVLRNQYDLIYSLYHHSYSQMIQSFKIKSFENKQSEFQITSGGWLEIGRENKINHIIKNVNKCMKLNETK